ncbi:hypothetical protein A1704_05175 [Chryseobacterium cucumeris]|nr:hypothetical protein A1704_05175 [Chryseobacterium cucumeris]
MESENLLERTNELIGQSGVIGETDNRLIMFLIFCSRKRNHPLHVVSLGSSGTGKTHLQESIGNPRCAKSPDFELRWRKK